jgi:CTP:molybdopterin cytidylyltransferase MocA
LSDNLSHKFQATRAPLVIPTCAGRRGNPGVIHRALGQRRQGLSGEVGARAIFSAYSRQFV